MTSRKREQTESLFGPPPHDPPPEPPSKIAEIDQAAEAPPVFASESHRPDCIGCHGTGFVPGEEGEPLDCPRCIQPKLSPALEQLRFECQLGIKAVDVGDCPEGVLWVWQLSDNTTKPMPVAIEHGRSNHDQRLLDFLTGYRLGMRHIPF